MARYKVEDIVKRVKVVIDQNTNDEAMADFGDVDTLTLDEILKGAIVPAVKVLEMNAPALMLGGGVDFKPKEKEASISTYNQKKFAFDVELPKDFMRLVALKMSDWKTEVGDVITSADAMYRVLRNTYRCVRVDADEPVVALVNGSEGNYAIEAYGSENDATLDVARYIPEPCVSTDGNVEICEPLYEAVVYEAASLAMQTIENLNLANSLHGMALSLAKIETKG